MVTPLACTEVDLSIVGTAGNNDHKDEQFRRRPFFVTGGVEHVRSGRETGFVAFCSVNR